MRAGHLGHRHHPVHRVRAGDHRLQLRQVVFHFVHIFSDGHYFNFHLMSWHSIPHRWEKRQLDIWIFRYSKTHCTVQRYLKASDPEPNLESKNSYFRAAENSKIVLFCDEIQNIAPVGSKTVLHLRFFLFTCVCPAAKLKIEDVSGIFHFSRSCVVIFTRVHFGVCVYKYRVCRVYSYILSYNRFVGTNLLLDIRVI